MAQTKGTDLVKLKKLFRTRPDNLERALLDSLDADQQLLYKRIIHSTWYPVEQAVYFYSLAAARLFPRMENRLFLLGRQLAQESYSGVYRIFLRIPSLNFILRRVPLVWKIYFDTGSALARRVSLNAVVFLVRDFPSMPYILRKVSEGHFAAAFEIIGGKKINIEHCEDNPHCWSWAITWD